MRRSGLWNCRSIRSLCWILSITQYMSIRTVEVPKRLPVGIRTKGPARGEPVENYSSPSRFWSTGKTSVYRMLCHRGVHRWMRYGPPGWDSGTWWPENMPLPCRIWSLCHTVWVHTMATYDFWFLASWTCIPATSVGDVLNPTKVSSHVIWSQSKTWLLEVKRYVRILQNAPLESHSRSSQSCRHIVWNYKNNKLRRCWQTRGKLVEVSQGHQTWYRSIC